MERAFDVWDEGHRGVLEISAISHDLSALLRVTSSCTSGSS